MMRKIDALSLTSNVNKWMANTRWSRILHIFDHACNLVNEHREILSIVTSRIGNGPFNLVVEDDVLFSNHLSLESSRSIPTGPISISLNQLALGNLTIDTVGAELWNPRPNWEMLHSQKENILFRLTQLPIIAKHPVGTDYQTSIYQFSNSLVSRSLISNLCSSLITTDISTAKSLASKLAGLGVGLTPAGDDFIMGAIHAAWIVHPHEIASRLASEIANTATPRTTSLSAAWLKAAGSGEAGILWHELFGMLIRPGSDLQTPISKILSVGETSGADALAGFLGVFSAAKNV